MPVRDRNLKLQQVMDITGFGKTKIYQMVRDGEFPPYRKIGAATRWSEVEVLAWQNGIWGHETPAKPDASPRPEVDADGLI